MLTTCIIVIVATAAAASAAAKANAILFSLFHLSAFRRIPHVYSTVDAAEVLGGVEGLLLTAMLQHTAHALIKYLKNLYISAC